MDIWALKDQAEGVFRRMKMEGWDHAIIGTISHSVFSKLYLEPKTWMEIEHEVSKITDWHVVDCHIANLANGDVVVTVILKG
jgi:uncharacterized Zn ribbon protein